MNEIVIRSAGENDTNAIANLWAEAVDYSLKFDPYYARNTDSKENFEKFIVAYLRREDADVILAKMDTNVIGYCLVVELERPPLTLNRKYGVVYDMAVTQNLRRCGIGTQLFDRAKNWFKNRGVRRIELNVLKANQSAVRFWKRMGFNPHIELLTQDI